jgi:catechol 2,3-dioxygenase-like lactoylglutathione lyase family enzyme
VPNLENLKKRAKTLVKQHRAGHYPVATRLRRGLSRFADLSDKAILAAPFALADALEVVAREEGFSSWANASRESKDMPKPKSITENDTPRLVAAYPQALVADVTCATEFYREKLGFRVVYLYGEPPFYALVERGGARLNLRHVHAPAHYRPEGDPDVLTANIPVEGIKMLYLELRARGVDLAQTLKEQPWGASDFIVRDPDGNLLCFASTVDHAASG